MWNPVAGVAGVNPDPGVRASVVHGSVVAGTPQPLPAAAPVLPQPRAPPVRSDKSVSMLLHTQTDGQTDRETDGISDKRSLGTQANTRKRERKQIVCMCLCGHNKLANKQATTSVCVCVYVCVSVSKYRCGVCGAFGFHASCSGVAVGSRPGVRIPSCSGVPTNTQTHTYSEITQQ